MEPDYDEGDDILSIELDNRDVSPIEIRPTTFQGMQRQEFDHDTF
jgi:hypothetical protein